MRVRREEGENAGKESEEEEEEKVEDKREKDLSFANKREKQQKFANLSVEQARTSERILHVDSLVSCVCAEGKGGDCVWN